MQTLGSSNSLELERGPIFWRYFGYLATGSSIGFFKFFETYYTSHIFSSPVEPNIKLAVFVEIWAREVSGSVLFTVSFSSGIGLRARSGTRSSSRAHSTGSNWNELNTRSTLNSWFCFRPQFLISDFLTTRPLMVQLKRGQEVIRLSSLINIES